MRYSFAATAPTYVAVSEPVSEPVTEVMPPPAPPPPRDSDGDGVMDTMDRCPDTPRGFRVDTVGCIIEQTVTLRGINFMFNSNDLTAPAQETLDEVATALVSQPTLNIQIIGHTDSIGSASYNQRLSAQRTEVVRRYLISRGVAAGNLQTRGDGEANPIASNETEEGRAENRRVQFNVLNKPDNVKVQSAEPSSESKSAAGMGEPKAQKKK